MIRDVSLQSALTGRQNVFTSLGQALCVNARVKIVYTLCMLDKSTKE
jgi:hypothetical protein